MTQAPDKAMEIWRDAYAAVYGTGLTHPDHMYQAAAQVIREYIDAQEAENRRLREVNDRLMIAAAATVKAGMDEYKRGHNDGLRKGVADGLEQAARIARAAQYSKSPATDTMRNIERLMDGINLSPTSEDQPCK